ncbi:MAG: bifunctional YncE family protein/alkaline phosphatase family protein [Terriglobales bacterium]
MRIAITVCLLAAAAGAQAPAPLPTGQTLTPLAAPGARLQALNPHLPDNPGYTAGQAVTTVRSPDGRTMLVLTSGYNLVNYTDGPNAGRRNPADSNEYVFVFDVAGVAARQVQALEVPNTYSGIAFSPDGAAFFVSGGDDDSVHVFARIGGAWAESQPPVVLGHVHGLGRGMKPEAAGLALTADGGAIVVADYENDAITVLRRATAAAPWAVSAELDLRPGKNDAAQRGVAGGEFPYWVAVKGNDTAYISSLRDRELVVVSLRPSLKIVARIRLPGQPNRLLLNRAQSLLFAAQDNADSVAVIATASNRVLAEVPVAAPAALFPDRQHYFGINPDALALSPDESTLYVSNGGENAIAVVRLAQIPADSAVAGLIPTAWYPNSVSVSRDGRRLYVVNGKSDPGPNPGFDHGLTPARHRADQASNQYVLQLEKAGFETLPVPAAAELDRLTRQVLENNHYLAALAPQQARTMAELRQRIHHVIYIVKENRTYDQVLGDLAGANGDPKLVEFPQADTPNFHALARAFVTFDDFDCAGGVSATGWPWYTAARTTDVDEKEVPPNYADRGLSYDTEGDNRGIKLTSRRAADLLPGPANVASPDGADENGEDLPGQGNLWDAALRRHLSLRNYGFWAGGNYSQRSRGAIPELPDPYASRTVVARASSAVLAPYTDPYFRGFDQAFPDYYRYQEWAREFDQYAAQGDLPNLELVRLDHDHFGNFGDAIAGLNTPELQMADDDYAVGLLVAKVARSRYASDTLIFIVEDDAQDGGDHVNDHRSPAFILGPYVRHGAVVSTSYNTVNLLRTIESVLGLAPLNLNDASAAPMAEAFDLAQSSWTYAASPSRFLSSSTLPIARAPGAALLPTRSGPWWARATRGMDFSAADHLDSAAFNRILWNGLHP